MLERKDVTDPVRAPYGKPETRLTTPNVFDMFVVEDVPISPEKYRPLPYKSPHPDFANNGLVLVWQGPVKAANNQVNVRRVYSTETDAPENWYNYAIKYSGDASTNPIFIRSYVTLRENYEPTARGSTLTSIMTLRVTNRGSGYSMETPPTVAITGGGGSGATAKAIVSPDGKIIGLQLTAEGTGYTSNPAVGFSGTPGTGAAASAFIQPAGAVLIKEELSKIDDDQLASIFVRVNRIYEVLPGPWLPYSRWDDNLGPIQGLRRAVLITEPPQASTSDVGIKTTYEARDGSSIVAMETIETWGREPYQKRFEVEINDPTPEKFRSDVPNITTSQIEPGRPELPELAPGEIRRTSEEVNKHWRREGVTHRDPLTYPRELADYELGGIHTHGSEFGGTLETKDRLHNQAQSVEEGFDIIASKVEALGHGLTRRRTTRLFTGGVGTGPYIELTDPGEAYVDDPAVIFSEGLAGAGAAGVASVSETPIAITDIDPGGVFTRTFSANGDDQGVFYFLGQRYNSGTWRNPADAGTVGVFFTSDTRYPVPQANLNALVDRSTATPDATIVPQPGGGHMLLFDLGPGRSLKANKVTFRLNTPGGVIMTTAKVSGFNRFGDSPVIIGNNLALPATAGAWTNHALTNTVGYRYFWIYGLDPRLSSSPEVWPVLRLGEVELYGELTIAPEVELDYSYNGDANGAFYYLGARGGSGTWRNPHTAGDIQITLPYDELELGTLDSMVDREPSNTYLVNRDHSEIWFDLGANRSLLLHTLTFRQRADYGSSMTQTAIQGSVDGVTFEEFQFFNPSSVASSWVKVDITRFTKYYRFFRLIIPVGKSFHSIGELELYGSLRLAAAGSSESPGFSVTGVAITNQGDGYAAPPRVVFSGGGPGTGAAGTAVIEDGKVVRVNITAAGSGYTSAPDVAFSVGDGGSGATAESTVVGGVVTAIAVVAGGSGYTEPPKVKIVSSTGEGATATAVLTAGVVTSITVTNGGSGYVRAPVVVLYPASDPEADAEIGFDVDAVVIVSGGSGYSSAPAVHISGDGDTPATAVAVLGFPLASVLVEQPGDGFTSTPAVVIGGNGTGAAGTAVRGFKVASTAVTAGGSGYATEPEVAVVGDGTDAQFQALIGRALLRIDMAASGSGYTSDPTVVITGDGTGAAAHVVRSFGIASIAVSAGGTGYTVAPTVAIPAPTGANGRQATAHAVLLAGAVDSIVIDDPGYGYLTAPTPTMTGGDGTGGTIGAATLASGGSIDSIVIDTAGADFSEPPIISFTGGAGANAAASAILNTSGTGPIVKIRVINAGKDYTVAPTLTIVPGISGGTGATATATLSTTGKIKSVTLTAPGSGYTSNAPVSFTGGGGSGASGTAIRAATGSVKSVTVLDPGDGFRAGAEITFAGGGGSGAAATVTPSDCGHVAKVVLTKPGGPFTVPPLVSFVGGQAIECVGGSVIDATSREAWVSFKVRFNSGLDGTVRKLLFVDYDNGDIYRGLDIRIGLYTGGGGSGPAPRCWEFNVNADPYNDPPYVNMIDPVPEVGVDYEILVHYQLSLDGTSCRITPTINGIPATTLPTPELGVSQLPYVDIDWPHASMAAGFGFGELAAGRHYFADVTKSPALAYLIQNDGFEWEMDYLKIGLDGAGSSNLLNASFASGMAPFSEEIGFSAVGGHLLGSSSPDVGDWPQAFMPPGPVTMRPAAALYRLGSSWPVLREEHTDPTEKIVILIDKSIVPPETLLPPGYSEKFPLDIYRSIQIVSKVNLRSLPPPETWDTTQHVQFPQLLLAVYPIWDTSQSQSTAGGAATGTQRGSVSASIQVIGSIVVTKSNGFRGAALATVERQFFFGPPPRELVPEPTIIRPSTGTAITVATRKSFSRSGLTYSPTGDSNPNGFDFASYAKSAGSSGISTQVVDLHDVLTAGIHASSVFNAANASSADALTVAVGARGTFEVDLPASTPFSILPGSSILAQVGVEKWRFGLFVRTLVKVTVPTLP